MSIKCSVISCNSRKLSSKSVDETSKSAVTFFGFPSSPTARQNWLENIDRPFFKTTRSSCVCSKHFDEKCLVQKQNRVVLTQGAVPLVLHSNKNKSTRPLIFNSSSFLEGNSSLNNSTGDTTASRRVTRSLSVLLNDNSFVNRSDTKISLLRNSFRLSDGNLSLHNSVSDTTASRPSRRVTRSLSVLPKNNLSVNGSDAELSRRLNSPEISKGNSSLNNRKRVHRSNTMLAPEIGTKKPRNSEKVAVAVPKPSVTHKSSKLPEENSTLNNKQLVSPSSIKSVPPITRRRNSVVQKKPAIALFNKPSANRVAKTLPKNQMSIKSFFTKEISASTQDYNKNPAVPDIEDGIFGWAMMGSHAIPFIVHDAENYCAIRLMENYTALGQYQKGNSEMGPCQANMDCYEPTEVQCNLLNEINKQHCDSKFGRKFTARDKLVRLSDANKYFTFMEVCHHARLTNVQLPTEGLGFGFTLVDKKAYIPYIVLQGQKFIPLIYLQCNGDILDYLHSRATKALGPDALALKLCCKYDGISEPNEWIEIINLEEIQAMSPPKTTFKYCWPKGQDNAYRLRIVQTTKGIRLEYIKRIA